MANNFSTNPMLLDTDFTSYRTAASAAQGIRPLKIVLQVGAATSTAGTVTITRPADSVAIYPSLVVGASSPPNTELYIDDPARGVYNWNDFAVTGLTATGTKLLIWFSR